MPTNKRDALFVASQYMLPHHLISRLIGYVANTENKLIKTQFIQRFARNYQVNMQEAQQPELDSYTNFNAFFTRALKPSARPIDTALNAIVSPADGAISQLGKISHGQLFQAKGKQFTSLSLLGGDATDAAAYNEGEFITIYLSPRDYHRLHMPIAGTLTKMIHIPGRLFSVNPTTANAVPNLFARNERVVALFDTELGPMALVLVGAMIVASIETVWHGLVSPPTSKTTQSWDYSGQNIHLEKGAEMGRFKLGSTIIALFPKSTLDWESELTASSPIQMGQRMGTTR